MAELWNSIREKARSAAGRRGAERVAESGRERWFLFLFFFFLRNIIGFLKVCFYLCLFLKGVLFKRFLDVVSVVFCF